MHSKPTNITVAADCKMLMCAKILRKCYWDQKAEEEEGDGSGLSL